MKAISTILALVVMLVSVCYMQGCIFADCNGMWTYDASEWSADEIARMNSAVAKINSWVGQEVVFIHAALPGEMSERNDRCVIRPKHTVVYHGKEKDGLCEHVSGKLQVSVGSNYEYAETYEAALERIEIIMAHEMLHGMGFPHAKSRNNIMYPSAVKTWDELPNGGAQWGEQDQKLCQDVGLCE